MQLSSNLLSESQINDFTLIYPSKFAGYEAVIVTDDKQMKTLRNTNINSAYTFQGNPVVVKPAARASWIKKPVFFENVIVGLQTNKIMFQSCEDLAICNKGALQLQNKEQALSNFKIFDIKNCGKLSLLAVMREGDYEYYEQDPEDNYVLKAEGSLKEEVFDVEAGEIKEVGAREFVVSTASGKVMGLKPCKVFNYKPKL